MVQSLDTWDLLVCAHENPFIDPSLLALRQAIDLLNQNFPDPGFLQMNDCLEDSQKLFCDIDSVFKKLFELS
jgi:hypothetical protein